MTATARSSALAPIGQADASATSLRLERLETYAAAEDLWRRLQDEGVCTPYQRFDWAAAYREAMAAGSDRAFPILLLRDEAGRPMLLLPLEVERKRGLAIASILGGKHANYHCPVMTPRGAGIEGQELRRLLRSEGRHLGIDAYKFVNLPVSWAGLANPLAEGGRPSPSNAYRAALDGDSEATLSRLFSTNSRKKLRSKEAKLRALGPVAHRIAASAAEAEAILAAFFAQKAARFSELGIADPFADPATRTFLRSAAGAGLDAGRPAIELHALTVGERIVATFGAAVDAKRCCGMFISFDPDPTIARASPGELLLLRTIAWQCLQGRRVFDLGVGEAHYKKICDETEELVDVLLPVTARGAIFAAAAAAVFKAKRGLKQTPWAIELVSGMRKHLARR